MEAEVVADPDGGIRLPAKVSRRRTGGIASSEVAGDTPPGAAGEGGGRPAAADTDLYQEEEEGLAAQDEKYMDKKWPWLMALSLFLTWAKARLLTHRPAWVRRARGNTSSGEPNGPHLLQARIYFYLWALSFSQEVGIVVVLCLFKLKLVSAGRARAGVRLFMRVGLRSSLGVLAVVAGSGQDWRGATAEVLTFVPTDAMLFVVRKLEELVAKVGRMFRG